MAIVTFHWGLSDEPLIDDNTYAKPSQEDLEALTHKEFGVTQNSATDAPFGHELTDEFKAGLYVDITTGEPFSYQPINSILTVAGLASLNQ